MKHTAIYAACAVALGGAAVTAQAGELYFDFNSNTVGSTATASLFLFGTPGQTASVSNLAGFSQTVTIGANGFFSLPIDNANQQSGTGIRNTGFDVVSSGTLGGYFINRAAFTTDMTYLLDRASLDKQYVVASQGGGFGEGSQVAIHATVANTQVTFTPRGGAPISVTLQAGQTYKYAGGTTDLTGSLVSANQNVAVFSGHECAQVPVGTTFCDTLLEQAIPISKLSKDYLLTASKGAQLAANRADLVRVIASADATQVKRDGVVVATLAKGANFEFNLAQNTGTRIETSEPALIAQYLTGGSSANTDPAMSYVPGADTWLSAYRLATPSGGSSFVENYASLVIGTDDLATLLLNGVTVNTSAFTPIGTTGFSRGNVTLPVGIFDLTAGDVFLLMLGGGSNADSYFTYGGSTFAPGISPPPPQPGVPEPASLALVGAALFGLSALRRRRQTV